MGNQLIKEQIIEILESDYCDGGPTLGSIADKIENLVNQEVEKRIKEIAKDAWFEGMKQGIKFDREDRNIKTIMETEPRVSFDDWYRSRLTPQVTPQDTPQVEKTEGGWE